VSDEYGVYYRSDVADRALVRSRNLVLWRLGSLGLSLGLTAGAWVVWPDQFGSWAPWIIAVSAASGLVSVTLSVIRLLKVRADANLARPGLAIGLNRDGMLVGQQWLVWPEVGSVEVRPGALGGSTSLLATGRDRSSTRVPLDYTDTMPATLDTAVRVLSSGRAWLDLSRLD
jgi:hypothetical protein